MDLLNRQIKAVRKTLERVIKEYIRNQTEHSWLVEECPLCQTFRPSCENCPLAFDLGDELHCCFTFIRDNEGFDVPLEDIAGFLQSLLVSLKEMKEVI